MSATIVKNTEDSVTIEVTIPLEGSMLESEEVIQRELNEAGRLATGKALERFDADGSPIVMGNVRFTSKGMSAEMYQTPYGQAGVQRHVYQTSKGGKTFCPLEQAARMVLNSTPRLAKMVSFKYASMGANMVARDFAENHGRSIAHRYVKNLNDTVGTFALAKEEKWNYELPELEGRVAAIGVSLDGTCMLLQKDGWRQAMCGCISLYDLKGERLHTIYIGAVPEKGKEQFYVRFEGEIGRIKAAYPKAIYVGLADGAVDNWDFLEPHVDRQILDFYHACEYVKGAAKAIFGRRRKEREAWEDDRLHRLKHKQGMASKLLREMEEALDEVKGSKHRKKVKNSITYFRNHKHQMSYGRQVRDKLPIGSGVIEAACKTLVKERLCKSGMRWKKDGASAVLSVRALVLTTSRWQEFWSKISRYGFAA